MRSLPMLVAPRPLLLAWSVLGLAPLGLAPLGLAPVGLAPLVIKPQSNRLNTVDCNFGHKKTAPARRSRSRVVFDVAEHWQIASALMPPCRHARAFFRFRKSSNDGIVGAR
jgi:hypothetical protein